MVCQWHTVRTLYGPENNWWAPWWLPDGPIRNPRLPRHPASGIACPVRPELLTQLFSTLNSTSAAAGDGNSFSSSIISRCLALTMLEIDWVIALRFSWPDSDELVSFRSPGSTEIELRVSIGAAVVSFAAVASGAVLGNGMCCCCCCCLLFNCYRCYAYVFNDVLSVQDTTFLLVLLPRLPLTLLVPRFFTTFLLLHVMLLLCTRITIDLL